jgi:hypothetical protein
METGLVTDSRGRKPQPRAFKRTETSKMCLCGRPAIGKTKGGPVCAECDRIERRLDAIEWQRRHPPKPRRMFLEKYERDYAGVLEF